MLKKTIYSISFLFMFLFIFSSNVFADNYYNYKITDDADLYDSTEEGALSEILAEISEYTNIAVVTNDESNNSTEYLASRYLDDYFRGDGIIFMIDMYNREIYISVDGYIHNKITDRMALTITDNSYKYASNQDYYKCTEVSLNQILKVIEGDKIAQPMRFITNLIFAFMISTLICYIIMSGSRSMQKVSVYERTKNSFSRTLINSINKNMYHVDKRYTPRSSSSGGGGHHGGGGQSHHSSSGGRSHHSSGCGHHGGGGHRF